jgi:branched-subunit amino acid ABC-type transport system permease component
MSPNEFGQIAVNAVLLSGILALVALGFSLVWGIMNIVNLSHGAFVVLGAYLTFFLHEVVGLDPFGSIPIVMLALFLLGFAVQQVLINQVIRAPLLATFLLTFGLEILIVNLVNYFFKADLRSVTTRYTGTGMSLGPLRIPYIPQIYPAGQSDSSDGDGHRRGSPHRGQSCADLCVDLCNRSIARWRSGVAALDDRPL